MTPPPSRLPRRFAQRQTLRHGRNGAPPMALPSGEKQPRVYEPRVKMKKRNRRRRSASTNDGESGPELDSELDRDSGYNSRSDCEADSDAEAMYYQQKEDEFGAALQVVDPRHCGLPPSSPLLLPPVAAIALVTPILVLTI
jgi:hypothetical protein